MAIFVPENLFPKDAQADHLIWKEKKRNQAFGEIVHNVEQKLVILKLFKTVTLPQ